MKQFRADKICEILLRRVASEIIKNRNAKTDKPAAVLTTDVHLGYVEPGYNVTTISNMIEKASSLSEPVFYLQISDFGLDLPSKAKWFPKWICSNKPG